MKAYSYIRFSTPEQKKGDSYRRQMDQTLRYCKEKGLELDKNLTFHDLGLSAFHGTHRKRGELGLFFELVEKGKVPAGSVLIVENLDRLSRENVMDAFDQFRAILDRGITIVTLMDKMEYSNESIEKNWTQLIISITYMAKAYRESKDKSDRQKEAWEHKRKSIDKKKLTSRGPLWLTLSKDKTHFERNEAACEAIELIYRMKLDGLGANSIAAKLNNEFPDIWRPPHANKRITGGWRGSYITKILHTRAVIGEFTPCTKVAGKRIPEMPIEGYYPAAISEELFYQVQDLMKLNGHINGNAGGQIGKFGNLFRHIAKCGLCGMPLHFIDKGPLPKGGRYLLCDASRRKLADIKCTSKLINYSEFENVFFEYFDTECLKIASEFIPNRSEIETQKSSLNSRLITLKGMKLDISEKQASLVEHIENRASTTTKEIYESKMRQHANKLMELEKEIANVTKSLIDLDKREKTMAEQVTQITSLRELLESNTDKIMQADLRLRLNVELKKMFEWIKVYPLQEPYVKYLEVEPGIVQIMHSKSMDRITYKLKDLPLPKRFKSHGSIYLKSSIDIGNDSLKDLLDKK